MRIMMSTSTASILASARVVAALTFVPQTVAATVSAGCFRIEDSINVVLIVSCTHGRGKLNVRAALQALQTLGGHGEAEVRRLAVHRQF
jgi:hypothetical protein